MKWLVGGNVAENKDIKSPKAEDSICMFCFPKTKAKGKRKSLAKRLAKVIP